METEQQRQVSSVARPSVDLSWKYSYTHKCWPWHVAVATSSWNPASQIHLNEPWLFSHLEFCGHTWPRDLSHSSSSANRSQRHYAPVYATGNSRLEIRKCHLANNSSTVWLYTVFFCLVGLVAQKTNRLPNNQPNRINPEPIKVYLCVKFDWKGATEYYILECVT